MTQLVASNAAYTRKQMDAWKDLYCRGADDVEAELFIRTAITCGLSPEKRQIFMVGRKDKDLGRVVYTPQVSIDGLRSIAQRTGSYEGQTPMQWCGPDGKWTDIWLEKGYPTAARVGVYRKGWREPLYAIAKWDSYKQTKYGGEVTHMWSKMADLMIGKCAEALALRRAFPDDMGGLYTSDEMAQATIEIDGNDKKVATSTYEPPKEAPKTLSPVPEVFDHANQEQIDKLRDWLKRGGSIDLFDDMITELHGKPVDRDALSHALSKIRDRRAAIKTNDVDAELYNDLAARRDPSLDPIKL